MGGDRGAAYNSILWEASQLIFAARFCGGERDISRSPTVCVLNRRLCLFSPGVFLERGGDSAWLRHLCTGFPYNVATDLISVSIGVVGLVIW